jgi:hypothetical protein
LSGLRKSRSTRQIDNLISSAEAQAVLDEGKNALDLRYYLECPVTEVACRITVRNSKVAGGYPALRYSGHATGKRFKDRSKSYALVLRHSIALKKGPRTSAQGPNWSETALFDTRRFALMGSKWAVPQRS